MSRSKGRKLVTLVWGAALALCTGTAHSFCVPTGVPLARQQRGSDFGLVLLQAVTVEEDTAAVERAAAKDAASTAEGVAKTDDNPRNHGLALMLDDGTRKSHSVAENTAFVSGFFKGIATKSAFANLVTSLYFVYSAMEDAFDETTDVSVKALDDPELRRVASLERDMEYFYGKEQWEKAIAQSSATRRYVERIVEIAESEPYLLVAHQYTRYLGDLFGGQMMGGMATRSLGLEAGKGTAFYNFDDIPSTKLFIDDWYRRLNELDLTKEEKEAIVDEANLVFELNIGILEELEGSPLRAMLMLAVNSFKKRLGFE